MSEERILELLNLLNDNIALIQESQVALLKVVEQLRDRILIAEEKTIIERAMKGENIVFDVPIKKELLSSEKDSPPSGTSMGFTHQKRLSPENSKEPKTPVKITVEEDIKAEIGIITEKAVQFIVGDQFAWIPKKCIVKPKAFTQGKVVNLELTKWFQEKVEWKQLN